MSKAIYPGTFDPVTFGHLDVLARANELFDEIIVAVAGENNKQTLFTTEERAALLTEALREIPKLSKVRVMTFSGMTVEFAKARGAVALIRGLRAVSDFEYELQLAMMNKKFAPEIETVFLMAQGEYSFINSSSIRWAASLQGNVGEFVPKNVEKALIEKYRD